MSEGTDSSAGTTFIQTLGLGLDPAWRRQSDADRRDDADRFARAEAAATDLGVRSTAFSSIGIEPGTDLLLWRTASSVDALEEGAAALLRAGMGRWLTV